MSLNGGYFQLASESTPSEVKLSAISTEDHAWLQIFLQQILDQPNYSMLLDA